MQSINLNQAPQALSHGQPPMAPSASAAAVIAQRAMAPQAQHVQGSEITRQISKHRKPDLFDQGLVDEVDTLIQQLAKAGKGAKDIDKELMAEYAKSKHKDPKELDGREIFAVKYHVYKRNLTPEQTQGKTASQIEESVRKRALSDAYDQISLINAKVKPMFEKRCADDQELKDLAQKIKAKEGQIAQLNASGQAADPATLALLEKEIDALQAKVLMRKALIKEQCFAEVYRTEMPKIVRDGFYDPGIILAEINKMLGDATALPTPKNVHDIKRFIRDDLSHLHEHGKISKHQLRYIRQIVEPMIDKYLTLYRPGRTPQDLMDAYVFVRNLARALVYQEIFDKSVFSGSDHGAKHAFNNIKGSHGLHRHMEKGVDYSDKDEFMEEVIHIYHDIGYSVGLAGFNFSCSKDHPMIGARFIEANHDYFAHYLDEDSTKSLFEGVLYHSIMQADMRQERRAVVSISDACALTYERKTQAFWEKPEAVSLIAKLKLFYVMFPPKESESNKKKCEEYVEVIRKELFDLVAKETGLSDDTRELFRQAIENQFNSMSCDFPLGQYGGVLVDVAAERLPANPDNMKYKPHFIMAPSLIYGLLKDLFGEDQASRAFGNLCEEFGLDRRSLNHSLERAVASLETTPPGGFHETVDRAAAAFTILNSRDPQLGRRQEHGHFPEMQASLHVLSQRLAKVKSLSDDWRELGKLADTIDAGQTKVERVIAIDKFIHRTRQINAILGVHRGRLYATKYIEILDLVKQFESGVTAQQKTQLKTLICDFALACGLDNA